MSEELDTTSPDPEAVKAFLSEKESSEVEEVAPKEETSEASRVNIEPSDFWANDERWDFSNMFVNSSEGDAIKVTEQDKSLYLKAVLNDVPLELEVKLAMGVNVKMRTLTVYETDVAFYAWELFIKEHSEISQVLLQNYMQQMRLAMQVTRYNGKAEDYRCYEHTVGAMEAHARELIEYSQKRFGVMQALTWGIWTKAMDVFERKVAKLRTADFNKDFWDPVVTD